MRSGVLNKGESVVLLSGFAGAFLSSALIALVVPFLSDGSEDFVLFKVVKLEFADGLDALGKSREGVDLGGVVDLVLILK